MKTLIFVAVNLRTITRLSPDTVYFIPITNEKRKRIWKQPLIWLYLAFQDEFLTINYRQMTLNGSWSGSRQTLSINVLQ